MEAVFAVEQQDGRPVAVLRGDWTSTGLRGAERGLRAEAERRPDLVVDVRRVRRCDTAGAYAIFDAAQGGLDGGRILARPETLRLLDLVKRAVERETPPP